MAKRGTEVRELLRGGQSVGVGQEIGKGEGGFTTRDVEVQRRDMVLKNLNSYQGNGLVTCSVV